MPVIPIAEDIQAVYAWIERALSRGGLHSATLRREFDRLADRVEQETEPNAQRDELLADLRTRANAWFAVGQTEGLPEAMRRQLDRVIAAATPDQLQAYRDAVSSNRALGCRKLHLLGLGDSIDVQRVGLGADMDDAERS